ncbi:MAG: T9SS type A sorting domain-containing protein, partial [Bacteroidales bacterium]|nr:T9SS type A sorting domain-containing protein [Bacteroidales bacterium]
MTLSEECQRHTSSFNYAFSNKFDVSTLGEGEIAFPLTVAYPNPFTDILNLAFINLNPSGMVKLYDQMGNMVFTANIPNAKKTSFHLSHLPTGVYFLQYIFGQHQQTLKILKMNHQKQ